MDEEEVGWGGEVGAKHKTQLGQRERHSINISLAESAEAQGTRTVSHPSFTLTLFPQPEEGWMHVANVNTWRTHRTELMVFQSDTEEKRKDDNKSQDE